ncbi:MAG: peptidylprolyl isomerase [Candidatus Hydrogenedentes bacterium]|nr:peptidylprolyl isomerase [Candidatus Hydrogenedentota bacterium]
MFLEAKQDTNERAQVEARMAEIKKQADGGWDFAALAKTYSAGPEASDGGLVGWVTRDGLVKELADVAFSLPEGGISNVLSTQFGLVILKVEKKEAAGALTLDEARKQIEPQLRAKAAGEKFKTWMTEQRKRSRVRIFLNS